MLALLSAPGWRRLVTTTRYAKTAVLPVAAPHLVISYTPPSFMSCKPVSATASAANIARRAVRSSPAARAAVGSAPLRRAIGAQRAARRLRPAVRFLLREARAGTVGRYRIRGTDLAVHLRHASRD